MALLYRSMPRASISPQRTRAACAKCATEKHAIRALFGYNRLMRSSKRSIAILLCALLLCSGCAKQQTGEWSEPLSSENKSALDDFFLHWAFYAVQHPPEEVDASWDAMAVCASRWAECVQSSGDVGRAQVALCPGTDLFATASLGHVVRARVTYVKDDSKEVSAESTFITACEACLYALGQYQFDGYDPATGFLELLSALEEDSRVREEGKIPSAQTEYNGCSMQLTTDEEQTALFFEIRHLPRKY